MDIKNPIPTSALLFDFQSGSPLGNNITITISDKQHGMIWKRIQVGESELAEKFNNISASLNRKEEYYITAIRNFVRKTNFLELYQQLLEENISEEEYNDALRRESNKYVVEINDMRDTNDIPLLLDVIQRIGFDLRDFSKNEIDEIFSTNISEKLMSQHSCSMRLTHNG